MANAEKYWINILVVILIFCFFYCKNVYDKIFEVQPGFIYHPVTDRLFFVELKPNIDINDKWSLLIPFRSPNYVFGDIGYADYLGKFSLLLKKREADKKRNHLSFEWRKNNPDAAAEKLWQEAMSELKKLSDKRKSWDLDFWDLKYFPRLDLEAIKILPDNLSSFKTLGENNPLDIKVADVMVVRWRLNRLLIESELIREAIVFRGRAALELNNLVGAGAYLVEDY